MLSKSAGQTLRVAACLNILFRIRNEPWPTNDDTSNETNDEDKMNTETNVSSEDMIIDAAIEAASNFIDVCCIQAAYMAGRTTESAVISAIATDCSSTDKQSNEKFVLLLPGKTLNLSDLLAAKKFRSRGGRAAALEAMTNLQADGLGVLQDLPSSKHSTNQVRMYT